MSIALTEEILMRQHSIHWGLSAPRTNGSHRPGLGVPFQQPTATSHPLRGDHGALIDQVGPAACVFVQSNEQEPLRTRERSAALNSKKEEARRAPGLGTTVVKIG
jgi:hypothetical protein